MDRLIEQLEASLRQAEQTTAPGDHARQIAAMRDRLEQLRAGEALTADDLLNAACTFDLPISSLLMEAYTEYTYINQSNFDDCLKREDIRALVFLVSQGIIRVDGCFRFIGPAGQAAAPVSEPSLRRARELLLQHGCPLLARRISTETSFYSVTRLSDAACPINPLLHYIFGYTVPSVDRLAAAFINALWDKAEKDLLLDYLLTSYGTAEYELLGDDTLCARLPRPDGSVSLAFLLCEFEAIDGDSPKKKQLIAWRDNLLASLRRKS